MFSHARPLLLVTLLLALVGGRPAFAQSPTPPPPAEEQAEEPAPIPPETAPAKAPSPFGQAVILGIIAMFVSVIVMTPMALTFLVIWLVKRTKRPKDTALPPP